VGVISGFDRVINVGAAIVKDLTQGAKEIIIDTDFNPDNLRRDCPFYSVSTLTSSS
jgi:hypothetical protein